MTTVSEWLRALTSEFNQETPSVGISMRRILVPGFDPLQGNGFLVFEAGQSIYRMGMPPEASGLVRWPEVVSSDGFNIEDDFPSHLGAALSLVSDRRIEVLDEFPANHEGTNTFTFMATGQVTDRRLISPVEVPDLAEGFKDLSAQLASLTGGAETAITTAIHLHYGAVLLFDRDLAAAYTLLIAALETLSREFGDPPSEWTDWDKAAHWDKFIATQRLTDAQAGALREELMRDRQLRLKQTLVNYVVGSLPDTFWSTPWHEYLYSINAADACWTEGAWQEPKTVGDFLPSDKHILAGALRKSYDARSSFVHSGKRVINMYGQLRNLVYGARVDQPLGFAGLRSILTALIFAELEAHRTRYEMPYERVSFPS